MSDEPEDEAEDSGPAITESYPDTLDSPDACWHFGIEAQEFLAFWCEQAGVEVRGSALCLSENASIAILLSGTGEFLTPKEIAAKKGKANIRRVQ